MNALFRTGTRAAARNLALFSNDEQAPASVRVEALEALGDWEKPHALDRIMGLWRPIPQRAAQCPGSIDRGSGVHSGARPESVQTAAIRSCARLHMVEAGPALAQIATDQKASPALRREALSAMGELKCKELKGAVEHALARSPSASAAGRDSMGRNIDGERRDAGKIA